MLEYFACLTVIVGVVIYVTSGYEATRHDRHNMRVLTMRYARAALTGGDSRDALSVIDEFDSVPFARHMWYRLTFRDPNRLYTRRVRDLANNLDHVIQISHDRSTRR